MGSAEALPKNDSAAAKTGADEASGGGQHQGKEPDGQTYQDSADYAGGYDSYGKQNQCKQHRTQNPDKCGIQGITFTFPQILTVALERCEQIHAQKCNGDSEHGPQEGRSNRDDSGNLQESSQNTCDDAEEYGGQCAVATAITT